MLFAIIMKDYSITFEIQRRRMDLDGWMDLSNPNAPYYTFISQILFSLFYTFIIMAFVEIG